MRFEQPRWTLKQACPVCGQGSCLVLVVCSHCGRLAVSCDEEDSTFFDPKQIVVEAAETSDASCPGCGRHSAKMFEPATADRIRAEGLMPTEYE